MKVYGIDIIIRMMSHVFFIYLTFWCLKAIRLDVILQTSKTQQIRVFFMLLSITIGYVASTFFLELIIMSKNLFQFGL